jgi:hypothetical protein
MKIPSLPKLSKRTWALIIAVILILTAIPALGLMRFTTSHPFFCLSCRQSPKAFRILYFSLAIRNP